MESELVGMQHGDIRLETGKGGLEKEPGRSGHRPLTTTRRSSPSPSPDGRLGQEQEQGARERAILRGG
ncbi:hypothetical protein EJB05_08240, partial [Eragrostis curvula]